MKRLGLLIAILLVMVGLPLAAFAQVTAPAPVEAAVADLSTRLGVPLTVGDIAQWTYNQNRYPDSSLGCSIAPNAPFTAGSFGAYQITLTYQGTSFDYRVSEDLQIVFPCDAALLSGTVPTPSGSTATPVGTLLPTFTPVAQPTVAATPTCPAGIASFAGYLTPRVTVGGQARVIVTGAPLRLRPSPSTDSPQIGLLNADQRIRIVGGPECANDIVWWQVTSDAGNGWVAEGILPDTYFIEPTAALPPPTVAASATAVSTGASITPAPTQPLAEGLPAIAGSQALNLVQFALEDDEAALVASTPFGTDTDWIADTAFTPDGAFVAFLVISYNDNTSISQNLLLADATGETVLVAEDLYVGMPVAFTVDGERLLYVTVDRENPNIMLPDGTAANNILFVEQPLDGSAGPQVVGQALFGVGCGGGFPYPGDTVFNQEVGYGGRPYVLADTSRGIVYTTACNGSGTALFDRETGMSLLLSANLSRVDVSPDRDEIIGFEDEQRGFGDGQLVRIDLQTLTRTDIETEAQGVLAAYATDGSGAIYFVTRDEADPLSLEGVDPEVLPLLGSPRPAFSYSLRQISADGDETVLVEAGYAYAVGRILPAPDGRVFYSTVPNGEAFIAALVSGEATGREPFEQMLAEYFPVALMGVDPAAGSEPVTLIESIGQAALNPAAFDEAAG